MVMLAIARIGAPMTSQIGMVGPMSTLVSGRLHPRRTLERLDRRGHGAGAGGGGLACQAQALISAVLPGLAGHHTRVDALGPQRDLLGVRRKAFGALSVEQAQRALRVEVTLSGRQQPPLLGPPRVLR